MSTPKIIGIVGASGSGKTTIAGALAECCGNTCLISQDNWYKPLPDDVDAERWNFDDPAVIDLPQLAADLATLKSGRAANGPRYIFSTHKRAPDTITLKPAPVIIVEGLFLFTTPELREIFDLKVFIDVPLDTCLQRRVQRDVLERGRSEKMIRKRWAQQVEPMFKEHVEPTLKLADFILKPDGLTPSECAERIFKIIF